MLPTLETELLVSLCALALGALFGLLYDGMRTLFVLFGIRDGSTVPRPLAAIRVPRLARSRKGSAPRRITKNALLFLCDLIYALTLGIAFAVFLYAYHDGVFRLFLLVAALLGMVAYFLTLGRLVSRVTGALAHLLHVALAYLFLCVRVPLMLTQRLCVFLARYALYWLFLLCARLLSPLATKWALFSARGGLRAFFADLSHPA